LVVTLEEIEKASVFGKALSKDNPNPWDTFEVSLTDIISNVNEKDASFPKYISDVLLTEEQIKTKKMKLKNAT